MDLVQFKIVLFILFYQIYLVLSQQCSLNCLSCNTLGQCTQCIDNYLLNSRDYTCYPSCNYGQSYDLNSQSCQSICPNQYFSNSNTKLCEQALPCPTMSMYGQDYFDQYIMVLATHSGKILVQGKINNEFSSTIKILDNQTYKLAGQLIGHDEGIIAMQYYNVRKISDIGDSQIQPVQFSTAIGQSSQIDGEEILVTLSRSQLILWNLNYDQVLLKILFPSDIIGVFKLTYISKDFIIVMKNEDTLNQFAVIYMQDIMTQPIYKSQDLPTLIQTSYKIFKQVHIKPITGLLIQSGQQIISYGQDVKLIQWNNVNQPNSYRSVCEFNSQIEFVKFLSDTTYLIRLDSDYTLNIYDGSKCTEIQTYHGYPIQWIHASPSPDEQNVTYFFSFSSVEVILYIYNQNLNSNSYISQLTTPNSYRFIVDNKLLICSQSGAISMYKFNQDEGLILLYSYNIKFTSLNIINDVFINNSDLILLGQDLTVFKLNPLPTDTKQLPISLEITDKKKNINKKMKQHTGPVNGILFDRLYDRIITYSSDGSFKIWEERQLENQGSMTDYRLILEQYHPSCNMLTDSTCQRQLIQMDILLPNLFSCQYNDNSIILWNYFPFKVTLNATLTLDVQTLAINNSFFYKNTLLAFNNANQLQIYNIQTRQKVAVINDSFFYAVLESSAGVDYIYYIRQTPYEVLIVNLNTKVLFSKNTHNGGLGFAKYYPEIQYLFFSSITANQLYIYQFLFVTVRKYTINQPVAISVDVVTKNFMVFQKTFDIAYYYWRGTTLSNYGLYTFSATVPQKLCAPLSNPEQHFFVQNTAFSAIKNQVISFSYQYENQMLLTFEDKIASIALDPITKKLYLGFQNGNIYSGGYSTRYYAYMDPARNFYGIYYYQKNRSIYAFNKKLSQNICGSIHLIFYFQKQDIHQIDSTTMTKPKIYTGPHKTAINDIIIDEKNNWIISYNNDTTTNFYRWDMNGTGVSQFVGGQVKEILKVFLDLDANRIISYSTDLTFVVWEYTTQKLLYTIDTHIVAKAAYDKLLLSLPEDQRIPYQIVNYYQDPILKRIISINNNNTLYMHYYSDILTSNPVVIQQNTFQQYIIPDMLNFFIDSDRNYEKIYIKTFRNMAYALQTYNFYTFIFEQQLTYHTDNIIGMQFKNTRSYSFQYTKLVIMDRKTSQQILSISTQNPLITNFIVFEKMDHIYLYSEWQKDILSYRLAVHQLSTGVLIKQILNSQYIENGNVNLVFLDEDNYQLLIYKSLLLNIFTVDVRTFQYTNYFTYKYVPPMRKVLFIKEHNLMVHVDTTYLEIYQMDFSVNTNKITQSMVEQKQPSYFYSQNSNSIYYIDVDNNAWQFGVMDKEVKYVSTLNMVRYTKYINGYFYVITDTQIIQFGDTNQTLAKMNFVNYEIKNFYFTNNFIFCENFYFQIIKLSYNPLAQSSTFSFQFTAKVKQLVSIDNLNQIIVILVDFSIYRIDTNTDKILQTYASVASLNSIVYDNINSILIHLLETGSMIFYLDFSTAVDYMNSTFRSINVANSDPVQQFLFDRQYNRIFVLNIRPIIPKIRVYSYNLTLTNGFNLLNTPQLITIIPSPTKAQHLRIMIRNKYFIIAHHWQILTYYLDTLELYSNVRDNMVLSTLKNYEIKILNNQKYFYATQYDSISIHLQDTSNMQWGQLNKFQLSYPNIVNSTQILDSATNYYTTQIIGVSNGAFFYYNFFIPNTSSKGTNTQSLSLNQCYSEYPKANTLSKIQTQLNLFNFSFSLLNLQIQKTLFQIEVSQKFYYDSQFKNMNSQVVYSSQESRALMKIINDSFSLSQLDLIQVKDYDLDISEAQNILFHSESKKITFKDVRLMNSATNFSFIWENLISLKLENINIEDLDLRKQSVIFYISNSDVVYINKMTIRRLNLYDGSHLLKFEKVKNVVINNLIIDTITVHSSSDLNNHLIIFKNVETIIIQQSQFKNISIKQSSNSKSNVLYAIQSQSVYDMKLSFVTCQNMTGISFAWIMNAYRKDSKTYFQYEGTFFMEKSQFKDGLQLVSPFILLQGNSYKIFNSSFDNFNCPSCYGGALSTLEAQYLFFDSVSITNCFSSNGGALSIKNSYYNNTYIYNSNFTNNEATLNGGGIYIDNTNLFMQDCIVQFNKALIGGGIRYLNIEPVFVYMMKNKMNSSLNGQRNLKTVQNTISFNTAIIHSTNIGSYVSKIKIVKQNQQITDISNSDSLPIEVKNDNLNLQTFQVDGFRSGHYFDFQFQLLDDEDNPLYFDLDILKKGSYPPLIEEEIKQYNIRTTIENSGIKIFGQYITDYLNFNSKTKSFQISQMQVVSNPETTNIFYIESQSILKVPNSSLTNRDIQSGPFHLTFIVNFRKCIIGELYKLQGSLFYCFECLLGTYSIQEPNKELYGEQTCQRCPEQAQFCYRNQMTLKPGYWKSENLTDSIVSCSSQESNCVGTEEQGYCATGHVGALCEYCDVQGKFWDQKYYSDGSYNCKECSQLSKAKNLVPTIFLGLGMVIYVLISIRIAWDISQLIVIGYYLRKLKFAPVSKSSFSDTTNMNMKAMMSYIQIAQLVNTVKVELPKWLTFFPEYVGSPVQNMIYTLDCYLGDVSEQKIPIIFLRTLWGLCIPLLYLSGMSIVYAIFVKLGWMRHNKAYIYSGLVFLFIFMQPNVISNLLGAMSCREIDGKKYILVDVSFRCYTDIHVKFISFICIPGLVIWGALIPFFILRRLNKNKQRLDNASLRLVYGFLYQDYKINNYYWEFVKSYMKIIIVCVYNFYGDPYMILVKFSPYQMNYFQQMDRNSMVVIIVLVIMNIFLYNKPSIAQQQIFYIILLGIHNCYLAFLFFEVVKAKVQISFKKQFDIIKLKISQYIKCLRPYLKVKKNVRLSTFFKWMQVRKLIHSIRLDKERGMIRDKVFGIGSSIISSQVNLQSPLGRSSELLVNREQASKSQFYNLLSGINDKQQDSIKESILVIDSPKFKQFEQRRHKSSLDKSESSNLNSNSLSIQQNQTLFLGSPLIQGVKDEVNESQQKEIYKDQVISINKPISLEQMLLTVNNSNNTFVMKDSLIGKNLKRVTLSTNSSNNQQSQQIFSKLKQKSVDIQDQKLFSNVLETNNGYLDNSPSILGECPTSATTINNKYNKDQQQNYIEQSIIEDIEEENTNRGEGQDNVIKGKVMHSIQTAMAQNKYFNEHTLTNSHEMSNSNQDRQFSPNENLDEIDETVVNKSIEFSYSRKDSKQQQDNQFNILYDHEKFVKNRNDGQDSSQVNTPSLDYQQQLEDIYKSNDKQDDCIIDSIKLDNELNEQQIIQKDDLEDEYITGNQVPYDLAISNKETSPKINKDDQTLQEVLTSKEKISPRLQLDQDIDQDDSFEYQKKGQKSRGKSSSYVKRKQSFKSGGKSIKGYSQTEFNPATMILDHQTIYTYDQESKSYSLAQQLEQSRGYNIDLPKLGKISSKQEEQTPNQQTERSQQMSTRLDNNQNRENKNYNQQQQQQESLQLSEETEEDQIVEVGTETINEEINNKSKQSNNYNQNSPNDGFSEDNFNVLFKDNFSSSPKNNNYNLKNNLPFNKLDQYQTRSFVETPRESKQSDNIMSDKNSKSNMTQIQDHHTILSSGQNKNSDQDFSNQS